MCNLYSVTKSQQAIRDLLKAMRDLTGNMPPLPAIFPNGRAPVVRTAPDGVRELLMLRWGFSPPVIPDGKSRNPYLTHVRKTDSRYWRPFLSEPVHRCLVPVTSFADAQRTAPHPAGVTTPVLLLRGKAGFPALHGNDRF